MSESGPAAIEKLIRQLNNEARAIRDDATTELVARGEAAFEPLVTALKDENALVRAQAATALGLIGDSRALAPLNQALADEDDADSEVCLLIMVALGKLGDDETIRFCVEGLQDPDSDERAGSAVALGMIGDKRGIPPLIGALGDKSVNVRCFAAAALGEIGDASVIPHLERVSQQTTNLTADGRRLKEVCRLALENLFLRHNS